MAKYEVTYRHIIERSVTSIVEADSEKEAIKKAIDGDYIVSDEDDAPEQGVEITDERATKLDDNYEI